MYKTPYTVDYSKREVSNGADPMFFKRWSPRSFNNTHIPKEIQDRIFEAARWAPSAYNEQPWRILASTNEEEFQQFLGVLVERNQAWAKNASILGLMLAKKVFSHNGEENSWAEYDTGFAWASLTFQANKLGLYTHGMAGFDAEKAYQVFNIDTSQYKAIAAFAIGEADSPEKLSKAMQGMEKPSERKSMEEIYFPGGKMPR